MKNILIKILVVVFTLSYCIFNTAFAEENIKVTIDGKEVKFDVNPMVMQDRTMVPMRAIFEKLGAKVEWDAQTQKITGTKGDNTIILTVGSNETLVNGEKKALDIPATEINGRVLVPLRFISESFGIAVRWREDIKTAVIDTTILFGKLYDPVDNFLKYEGEIIDGEPGGIGRMFSKNGIVLYDGEWVNGAPSGIGKGYSDEGILNYDGEWKDWEPIGVGKIYDKKGVLDYEGDVVDGIPNGKGKEYSGGKIVIYEGDFKDGKRFGNGKTFANGKITSEGEYDGDLFKGKAYYDDGSISIEKDLHIGDNGYNGTVKRYYPDGKILMEAEVQDNLPTVNTVYYNKDGSIAYQGEEATKVTAGMLSKLIWSEQ